MCIRITFLSFGLIAGFFALSVYAESVTGKIEKLDYKAREIVVGGVAMKVAGDTMISSVSELGRDQQTTFKNLVQYEGYVATCRYFDRGKSGIVADKIRVREWR